MSRNRLKRLILSAILAAMSVILIQFLSLKIPIGGVYSMNIGFGVVPVISGGLLMGPLYGATIGAVADFIKSMLFPTGGYFPGFTLTYALIGFAPAFLMRPLRRAKIWRNAAKPFPYIPLLICVLISQILFSAGLNTYWLSFLGGSAFSVLLPFRLVNQLVLSPLHALIIYALANHRALGMMFSLE